MFCAVRAGSPGTNTRARTPSSANAPRTITMRYSEPARRALAFGDISYGYLERAEAGSDHTGRSMAEPEIPAIAGRRDRGRLGFRTLLRVVLPGGLPAARQDQSWIPTG